MLKKFDETIIYKENSELEKQIQALNELHNKFPKNESISRELKNAQAGLKGENEIEYELKNADIGMYILHDINLNYNDDTAQIDYVIITPAYTYFVECKNLIGDITVDENGQFIREYNYDGKLLKKSIYSPLTQAEKHIDIFKKIWKDRHKDDLLIKLLNVNLDNFYKPLVVITNKSSVLNIDKAPNEIKKYITRSDLLVKYIKNDISRFNKDLLSSKKNMYESANNLMLIYNKDLNIDYIEKYKSLLSNEEIDILNNANREDLKKELLEFRNKKSKKYGISLDYVFTEEELEILLDKRPKNIEELNNLKIFNKEKIKYHGNDIIEIINKERNE